LLISTLAERHEARHMRRSGRVSLWVMRRERPYPPATFSGPAGILTEEIGVPSAKIAQRIASDPKQPEPLSDQALAEIGRGVPAIAVERVTAATHIAPEAR
jgi:hypothetical protein